jgi:hypothetical protein
MIAARVANVGKMGRRKPPRKLASTARAPPLPVVVQQRGSPLARARPERGRAQPDLGVMDCRIAACRPITR